MNVHDHHKLTLVNFSEYERSQALVIRWVYLWLGREEFLAYS